MAIRSKKSRRSKKISKRESNESVNEEGISIARESVSVLLLVVGVFLATSFYSYLELESGDISQSSENLMGPIGHSIATLFFRYLGWCSFVTVLCAFASSRTIWLYGLPLRKTSIWSISSSIFASVAMAAACASTASILFGYKGGGLVGSKIAFTLVEYVNEAGTLLICVAVFILSLGLATGIGTMQIATLVAKGFSSIRVLLVDACFVIKDVFLGLSRSNVFIFKALGHGLLLLFQLFTRGISLLFSSLAKLSFVFSVFKRTEKEGEAIAEEVPVPEKAFVLGRKTQEVEQFTDDEIVISRNKFKLEDTGKGRGRKPIVESYTNYEDEDYEAPSLDLLVEPKESLVVGPEDEDLRENSKRLEQALVNFKIGGKIVEVHPGPVVTLYQFQPAAGIKVQRVINLADDLALALRVGSVRVYAPVPGKGTVGIEVPNSKRELVRLRSILETEHYADSSTNLPLALGKNTFGEPFVADLCQMPHLLIAGATGTGKSVCINSLLLSLLCRHSPKDLRLILIDPKMLELSVYEDIPHLKAAVVTNPKRARGVLWWAVEEMERRYRLMRETGVRNLDSYNRLASGEDEEEEEELELEEEVCEEEEYEEEEYEEDDEEGEDEDDEVSSFAEEMEYLPRIVIVVDELADLMLTVGREIEELLTRLAQKARAAGIHMILATQRPSVNVITGLIKANFPARISFKVASRIDSRTILDGSGSEKLLGQGDMLFLSPGLGGIKRLHGPYVSDREVNDVVAWLREQGAPDYDDQIVKIMDKMQEMEGGSGRGGAGEDEEYDPLYDKAVNLVIEKGQASTSMVQRVFRIGYNRAARILECMEREGVVGPADGAKPRRVLQANSE